jgi:RHS repeat-associated protein
MAGKTGIATIGFTLQGPSHPKLRTRSLLTRVFGALVALLFLVAALPAVSSAAECTNTWIGATEGTWQTTSNWSAGHAPTSSEVACIGSGKTVKVAKGTNQAGIIQGEGKLTISESSLELVNASEVSSIKTFTLSSGGTLTDAGTLNVTSSFTWSGGTLAGKGSIVLLSGATGVIEGSQHAMKEQATFVNEGTTTYSAGWISMYDQSKIKNPSTFNANSTNVSGIAKEGAESTPQFVNSGTLRKTVGTGATRIGVEIHNEGSIQANAGPLNFARGGVSEASAWLAAEGTTIILSGGKAFTFNGDSLEGAFKLEVSPATLENLSTKNLSMTVVGSMSTGEAPLRVKGAVGMKQLTLGGDTTTRVIGPGTIDVTGSFNWNAGTIGGTGLVVVTPGASASIEGAQHWMKEQGAFVNEGTTTYAAGWISMYDQSAIENSGTFNANSTNVSGIAKEGAESTPQFVNSGTLRKTSGTAATRIGVELHNEGSIQANAGPFTFVYGAVSTGGSWSATEGTAITLSGGKAFLFNGGTLEGRFKLEASPATLESPSTKDLSLTVAGSVFTAEAPLSVKGTVDVEQLTLNGDTLARVIGPGTIDVTSSFNWNAGTLGGTGSVVVRPGGTASIEGSQHWMREQGAFVNEGTTTYSAGWISMYEQTKIENSGTFNANSENSSGINPEGKGATPHLTNTGPFQKTGGTGTTHVNVDFANYGSIGQQTGKLEIPHPVTIDRNNHFGKRCHCGDPIETATGDFSESQTDFTIGGRGVGLVLDRTYSTQAAVATKSAGAFGYGWNGSFSDHLNIEESGANVTLTLGDADTVPFTRVSGSTYSAPTWSQETLNGSPEAGYTFTRVDQTEFRFSGAGRLESVADRNGNETMLSYDEAGRLKAITDPTGRQITFAYNAGGQVESAKDPMGRVVKYAYEGGNLASVTMPGETAPNWEFKYDASHRMTSMTDGRGGKTTNEYDGSNRVISQTNARGRTLTFKYESFHTTITNKATGAVTDEWFTSNNEPFSITRGYGTAVATTETFSYNEAGRLTSMTDGDGHTTTYGYDTEGNRTSKKDPAGDETKWAFNGTHDVVSMTTPLGETTTLTRDTDGNVESISRPAPGEATQTTTVGYNAFGEPETVTDPLNRTWLYSYDEYGNRTSETDPAGDTQTLAYDEDSRLISLVSPRGNVEGAEPAEYTTTIERDAQGRRRKVIDPLGHTIEYAYDADGNLVAKTDRNGHTTKYVYDADNQPIKTEAPNGDAMETAYDGAGQVTSQTNGNEHTTTYVRNVLEQPVEVIDPLGRKTTEEFDAAGNLKTVLDAAERKASYAYDAANRLVEVNYSEEATPDVKLGYDAGGNVTSMLDGTGESSYSYDQLGRLTHSEDGHGDVVGYGYDLAEELTGIAYPNGKSISRTFDPTGRLESVTDWLGGKTMFAYNADSELQDMTFPAGSGNVDEFAYDRIGRMSEAKFTTGAETLASLSYGRDNAGQVVSDLSQGLPEPGELAYGYDANSRLTTAGEASYEYDASDNVTKAPGTTNTYDAASQLEAGTGVLYSYDNLGNRIQASPSGGPATSYAYDQAGNLTSVKRPEEGEVPAIAQNFTYDGNGLMASQTSGLATNYMTWDCNAPLPQILSDGQNSYIYGPGGLPIEQISAEESPTYLHHDQLGSTRMLTSPSGEAVGAFTYGAYGQLEAQSGSASTPMGYAGQYTDGQSGLQYLRARFYDPSTAQFMTLDPIVPRTRAPYDYTGDNPLNRVDPRGLCGVGSVSDVLESFNPISEENCAYQGAEELNDATGVDLPGTLSQPEVVDAGAVATCLAPVADVVCGGALTFSFIDSSAGVVHEGIETNFCNSSHLAAEEGVNVLMFGFGGLSLKTAGMMAGAPLAAKAAARGGPAAAQGLLDGAESQHQ